MGHREGLSGVGKRRGMARGRPIDLPKCGGPGERKGGLVSAKLPFFHPGTGDYPGDPEQPGGLQGQGSVVMVAPDGEMPRNWSGKWWSLTSLPTRDELRNILDELVEGTGIQAEDEDVVLDAAKGLTWRKPRTPWPLPWCGRTVRPQDHHRAEGPDGQEVGGPGVQPFKETFETLGGLENLKDWTLNRFKIGALGCLSGAYCSWGSPGPVRAILPRPWAIRWAGPASP